MKLRIRVFVVVVVAPLLLQLLSVASCFTFLRQRPSSSIIFQSSSSRRRICYDNDYHYYSTRSYYSRRSYSSVIIMQRFASKFNKQSSSARRAEEDPEKSSSSDKEVSSVNMADGDNDNVNNKNNVSSSSPPPPTIKATTTKSATVVRNDGTYSARFLGDNGLEIITDETGTVTARPRDLISHAHSDLVDTLALNEKKNNHKVANNSKVSTEKKTPRMTVKEALTVSTHDNDDKSLQVSSTIEKNFKKSIISNINNNNNNSQSIKTKARKHQPIMDVPAKPVPQTGFNVVLTHATADFDSLASAVGLAKLWSASHDDPDNVAIGDDDDEHQQQQHANPTTVDSNSQTFSSASNLPTFVVLPRGAHPGVHKFLSLHKHLFPIRSLKSLPSDLSGLNRLALVDAQRRDRLGPAEPLLQHANRITVVDHHIDQDSDIPATDYVVDKVGSVSALICELLQESNVHVTEVEATLLALGIHADTGSLRFDSTTPRDAKALAWCLEQGASQVAIAEHAQSSLSAEQQNALTQSLINVNSTVVHGVTLSTVLLSADGFINGLASVTQDALELSSSDIFITGMVYEATSGGSRRNKSKQQAGQLLTSRLLRKTSNFGNSAYFHDPPSVDDMAIVYLEAWKGGDAALKERKLRMAFDRSDRDRSGTLDIVELKSALASYGIIAADDSVTDLMEIMDTNGDGGVDFEEFVQFALDAEQRLQQQNNLKKKATTMILVGRVKGGVSLKAVNLSKLFAKFGGGGHAKAASATVRLNDESEAEIIMQELVDELIQTSLQEQPTVGDFMTSPCLSLKPHMTETQVEALFTRYDVRALPVVDEKNDVIGLVTYKEVASAKQRLWNKEQKRIRLEREGSNRSNNANNTNTTLEEVNDETGRKRHLNNQKSMTTGDRKSGSMVKGWMLQHIRTVEASKTMAEVESVLLDADIGCIPVVADGTNQLVGMVTRTDLLRQHRYYNSLYYNNRGMSDSIANRRPAIIALRKKLKMFDLESE